MRDTIVRQLLEAVMEAGVDAVRSRVDVAWRASEAAALAITPGNTTNDTMRRWMRQSFVDLFYGRGPVAP
jgi:hypothetical protein